MRRTQKSLKYPLIFACFVVVVTVGFWGYNYLVNNNKMNLNNTVTDSSPAKYGERVRYNTGRFIEFPDFQINFLGKDVGVEPNNPTLVVTRYDFALAPNIETEARTIKTHKRISLFSGESGNRQVFDYYGIKDQGDKFLIEYA